MEYEFDRNGMCVLGILLPGYRKVSGTYTDRYNFQTLYFPAYNRGQTMAYELNRNEMCVLGTLLPGYRKVSGTYTGPL